jgi:hypothetical protein
MRWLPPGRKRRMSMLKRLIKWLTSWEIETGLVRTPYDKPLLGVKFVKKEKLEDEKHEDS